jgi:hypothetical protein
LLARLKEWKPSELRIPKIQRTPPHRKSKQEKYLQLEAAPKAVSATNHSSEELPSSQNIVAGSSAAPSVPQETSPFSILNSLDLSPGNVEPILPSVQDSERHSSSSSEYGRSYRSRSSSGPSIYHGSDPTFPYSLRFESLESVLLKAQADDAQPLERRSSGSWHSISPPTPELNRPPSTRRDPTILDRFQSKSNAVLERFMEYGTYTPPNHDKERSKPPTVETDGLQGISVRRRAAVTDPFPFPIVEDTDDEGLTTFRSRVQNPSSVRNHNARLPFSSPIIEDNWHGDAPRG